MNRPEHDDLPSKSFSDSEVAGAFGFAMWQHSPERWQPPTPEELEGKLPGYRVETFLGRGGMGAVYRAVQEGLDRPVAVKVLPPGLEATDPTFAERFAGEARLMAKLAHPNVVTVFDTGQTADGRLYYAMELMDGTDAARRLAEEGRLRPEEARAICLRVCDALEAAHEIGIVHRDIKPANVLISAKGVVKVADFGLARLGGREQDGLTLTGHVVGTPDFTAPEAHQPGVELDGRADLYATGVMLHQMLTGHLPRGAFKPASELVPGLDPRFDGVISRAMQEDREDRYQMASHLRHDLEQLSVVESRRKTRESPIAVPVGKVTAERHIGEASPPAPVQGEVPPLSTDAPSPAPAGRPTRRRGVLTERRIRSLVTLMAVALCALAGIASLRRTGERLASLGYDLPFLFHKPGGGQEVTVVYLDQMADGRLDRSVQAPLLDRLRESGARAAVYDILFDEPWPDPGVDAAFATAIRKFREGGGVVVLAAARETSRHEGVIVERIVPPCDPLLEAADGFGLVAFVHDDRHTVRELPVGTRDEPSLVWRAALALGTGIDESRRLEPRWINYVGPPPHPDRPEDRPPIPSVPVGAALGEINPSLFRNRVVVIGGKPGIVGSALGADLFSSPYHRWDHRGHFPLMSGVEIQANALLNLLNGNWLGRSGKRADQALVLCIAVAAGVGLSRLRPLPGLAVAALGFAALALAGVLSMHYGRIWFPWTIAAFVQLPVAFVGGTMANYYVERFFRLRLDADQRRLREAFSRYVSPKMLDRLADRGFPLDPGGEKTLAAMMFTDIENFTDICERVTDPIHIVDNLNDYFQRTTEQIFEHDGVVIKYIGDAIFAAWGVPLPDGQAALKSVRAAWRLHLNAALRMGGESLRTRVGLHFGEVVAGNIGSTRHIDYTLVGDAVNLAARLEQLNKTLGTTILMSEETARLAGGEFSTRRVGLFRVKGRRDTASVHELLGPVAATGLPSWAETYAEALAAFEEGDRKRARRLFEETDRSRLDGDGPSRFFLEHLARTDGGETGVVELREK